MRFLKQIPYILLTIAIIISGGVLSYNLLTQAAHARDDKVKALREEYKNTGEQSILLQIGILNPREEEMANITRLLLDAGDYQTADFINYLHKVPNYNLLAAQSALFDKNVPVADKYLASISAGTQYDELIAFKGWVSSLETNYTLLTTETDAGKFMYMINERDLTLFTIDGDLGREIGENNVEYPERLQNIFHNAKLLANYGFYAQAITLLSSEHLKCNTEYHIFRASLYEEMGNPRESYNQVEEGLVCDPTNSALLKEAVRYSRLLTRDAEADNYQARLKQLENLQN